MHGHAQNVGYVYCVKFDKMLRIKHTAKTRNLEWRTLPPRL